VYAIFGGLLLGWALGANDAANVFGTAVASRIVRYRTAVILAAIFIVLGAVIQGTGGIETLSELTKDRDANSGGSANSALIVALSAAATVIWMTRLKLPVSTSQAVVGAIIGAGLTRGFGEVPWGGLGKVVACWVGTPTGAALIAFLLYPVMSRFLASLRLNIIGRSVFLKTALIISGCYGAYALGGNSAANVTGVFFGADVFHDLPIRTYALIGGLSIALGVVTYSRGVMLTVGSRLVQLDAFSALVAVAAQAMTVHVYAFIGVPVSTSQAIVGAVLGIGLFKGVRTVNKRTLLRILSGWLATPLIAGIIAFAAAALLL